MARKKISGCEVRQSCNQLLETLPKIGFSKNKIITQCCYFPGEFKGDDLSSSHVAAAGGFSSQGFSPQGRTQSWPVPLRQGLFSLSGEGLQLVQQISNTSSNAGIAFPGLLQETEADLLILPLMASSSSHEQSKSIYTYCHLL